MIQSIQEIQGETGPNGERVFKPMNDQHDAIRMVGGWFSSNSASGQSCYTDVLGSYAEITFYGTGLNLLTYTDVAARDISVSIDGVAQSNILNIGSGILGGRNYSMNRVINIASNLSLGLHTVKVGIVNGTFLIFGYEVLNTNSTIQQTPGTSYAGGRRLYSPSLTTSSYSSGFTNTYGTAGTKGGCVLVYQKADGTIAKDIRYADTGAALTLTSANHANEEVIRTYHWREFGAGRTDDFSSLTSTTSNRAFTLDDGTTTLVGQNVHVRADTPEALAVANNGDFWVITFIGTGLDIVRQDSASGGSDTYAITIDGASAGNLNTTGSTTKRVEKIVSGLSYGTHTIKMTRTAASTFIPCVHQFIVYAPTAPSLPSGAVSLGQYYLMGDFSPNSTASIDTIAAGTLRKSGARELVYVNGSTGSVDWSVGGAPLPSLPTGFGGETNRLNAYFEYTFFGTGFEYRSSAASNISSSIQFSLQNLSSGGSLQNLNTTNFPTISGNTSAYGTGVTFTASTGIADFNDAASTSGCGIRVSNLPLALYKVRATNNVASSYMLSQAIDIITPVHAPVFNGPGVLQNTLAVGSCAMMDKRKFSEQQVTPVKVWAQTAAVSSGPSTALTTFVPLADLSTTVYASTDKTFSIQAQAALVHGTIDGQSSLQIFVNGAAVSVDSMTEQAVAGRYYWHSVSCIVRLPAGQHKIDCYFRSRTAGTTTSGLLNRSMTVQEL
jgi:hypothetical protein